MHIVQHILLLNVRMSAYHSVATLIRGKFSSCFSRTLKIKFQNILMIYLKHLYLKWCELFFAPSNSLKLYLYLYLIGKSCDFIHFPYFNSLDCANLIYIYIHVYQNTKNVQEHLNVVLLYGVLLRDKIVLYHT